MTATIARPRSTSRGKPPKRPSDPVTAYAEAVVSGATVAGWLVVLACKRHLHDLTRADLTWDVAAVARVIGFFRDVLRLNGGEFEGQPFVLEPWQAFIVGSLFGWKRLNGRRRYQLAFIEIGKGNGKSPIAAGIGHYMLLADGEQRAEVYAAATKKDQAMVLFRDAVAMRDLSPDLKGRLKTSGTGDKVWNLYDDTTSSFFRPIASEDTGQSGPRPSCALLDEVHEHRTAVMVDMMRKGFKGRRNPLAVEITNSGFNRHSICYQHHDYSIQILEGHAATGGLRDDKWFAFVCTLDPCATCRAAGERAPKSDCKACDQWTDERVWMKANPNLGVSIEIDYLRNEVTLALGMPALQNTTRRLNFCEWTEQSVRAIDMSLWDRGSAPVDVAALEGRVCYAGIDLAKVNDLSALALLFPPIAPDEPWKVLMWYWCPKDDIAPRSKRDKVPYDVWEKQGFIEATPGNTTDYDYILARIVGSHRMAMTEDGARRCVFCNGETAPGTKCPENKGVAGRFDIRLLAFDRTFGGEIIQSLQNEMGEDRVVEFGQGFISMAAPTAELLRLVKGWGFNPESSDAPPARLQHGGNPVLRWNAANLSCATDAAGNLKPDKENSVERIDGVTAICNARGVAQDAPDPTAFVGISFG